MLDLPTTSDDTMTDLLRTAERLVALARTAGATAADATVRRSQSFGVEVRNGKVESTDQSESDGLSLRVFVGQRVASMAATPNADLSALAERAVAMAKASPEDPVQGLADPDRLAKTFPDLDLFDATGVAPSTLTDMARAAEEAGLAVPGVTNSVGASAGTGVTGMVLVTSHGFSGQYRRSGFSVSASLLAGQGTGMERDYDFCSRIHFADLDEAAGVGRRAGERAVRRLGATKPATGRQAIVFDPRVARGLIGHLASAVNGASIVRKSSFLRNRMGEAILPASVTIIDDPMMARRPASRPFDGEGVAGEAIEIVRDGVLMNWLLSTEVARDLGLQTNGRGVRSGNSVTPSATNFIVSKGDRSPADLIRDIGNGIYVTEVIGQGVNLVTGQYSRGASGFEIRNGELAGPVSEFTIASDLEAMYGEMLFADDQDPHYSVVAPTLAVPSMMVAGA